MVAQKNTSNERYMLKGSLRKNGFDRWRLVTVGREAESGEERVFFIEFYVVNPLLSPEECILGFKSRIHTTEEDLHAALAGTASAKKLKSEDLVQLSFAMVRAGILCTNGRQINGYFPSSQIQIGKSDLLIKVGNDESNYCSLTTSSTYGTVSVTQEEVNEHPELLSHSGKLTWNLHYVRKLGFSPDLKTGGFSWVVNGAYTEFEGKIVYNLHEYIVTPEKSFGYIDKMWGHEPPSPFFHLHSSNFTSIINGKKLDNSCFVVQGEYNSSLSVLLSLQGKDVTFNASKSNNYDITYDFSQMPDDEDGVKYHWTVSVSNRSYVVDIDAYCDTKAMFLRDYECPEGNRKVLRLAGGGTGSGELRLYKKIKKNLELIEHVHVANIVCEYGNIELPNE
ncbi:MAG: hypothetical protein IKI90_05705 [Treponema sp.]|nr:hypothetical protein [Treponema sp.]